MDETTPSPVRLLRHALGWSQELLAERAGLLRTEVSKIETGHNKLSSFATRQAIAKGFGLTMEQLADLLDERLSVKAVQKLLAAPTKGAA